MATPPDSKRIFDNFVPTPTSLQDADDSDVEILSTAPTGTPNSKKFKDESKEIIPNSKEPSSGPRRKRQRLILEVVVPTWEAYKKETAEDFKKLKNMKNPIVKKIKNMDLLVDTVRDRLKPIGLDLFDITLDKFSQEVRVGRDFMSSVYGGSMQATFPKIRKELVAKHGMNDFAYLNPDYQPEAPEVPGAPGLFFGTEAGPDRDGTHRVLTRIGSNSWQYMGMYVIKSCPSLSKEEWADQLEKVRKTWAKQICVQDWGINVRVRVRARKELGRQPTKAEFNDILTSGRFKSTTPEEVEKAYDIGVERLGVWTTKCVGYHNAFQLQLCEKFPLWVPRPRKPRGSNKQGKNKSAKPKSKPKLKAPNDEEAPVARGRKRKRSASPDSDLTEPESEDSDQDEKPTKEQLEFHDFSSDEETGLDHAYKSKGTRSRPIRLDL
ncbi:hypothetical protein GALMADRAFT_575368 [Galerina marginata CBS 339.88]|uniref:DUF6697 domain-containing protein n=1 Tax=Galerina marginata (strain CBS 339.88) TaxID=685588 RepID=A0A067STM7_GALM3|nr:hypothetical protein GALMADRAFT_575368 [Galerina marginata CBS 339.88]